MTPKQQKEQISLAYLSAVVSRAGFAIGEWRVDHGCVDVTIGAAGAVGKGTKRPKLDVQLKCTNDGRRDHEDKVACSVPLSQYEHLRLEGSAPMVLVVLVLPADETKWICHGPNAMVLRHCAYWVLTTGMPPAQVPPGQDSTTVYAPKAQMFSPQALGEIMERVSQDQLP